MKWLPKFLIVFLLVPLSISITGCQRTENPLGRKTTHVFSPSYLHKQADAAYADEKKKNPQSANVVQQALVQRVGQRLIAIAKRDYPQHCQGFNWEVNLFEKPKIVNAYCMPGGKIAFYTGILPICRNEAGVAAVMGHEICHALLRHGSERVTRSMVVNALVIGAAIGLGSSKMQENNRKAVMAAIGLGSQVGLILPFSRNHESEADRMGLELMAKAGYEPAEAPEIWVRMSKQSGGQAPPEFLSTHPSNQSRIAELTSLQPGAQAHYKVAPNKYGKGEDMRF
ncbi:MAG: M48 family metallopeptidase [Planctomycetota bacterium]|nr:M48 family metallopeptidase [Planctomycetota bacterium]